MDPQLDPPPVATEPSVAAATTSAAAANPSPALTSARNHPPYAEMISAAITALKERDGSSKRAIAKYIETHYSDLPQTHSALLTHHLKRLKTNGQLLMVKNSYKLPRSTPAAVNGAVSAESPDPVSAGTKRRPGRPPKPKPDAVQAAVPVFPTPINMNIVPVVVPEPNPAENVAIGGPGTDNGEAAGGPVRGRGRPPKQQGVKRGRGRGRPPKQNASTTAAAAAAAAGTATQEKRPRGRPPKPINVVEGLAPPVAGHVDTTPVAGGGVTPVTGKRRGRPPKAFDEAKTPLNMNTGQHKKPRNLSGKPLGRPKKNASAAANRTPDSQLLVAYLDLKAKLENLQSIVKQTAILIRPSLNSEAAITALQELELVAMNASAPPNAQSVQPPQPQV